MGVDGTNQPSTSSLTRCNNDPQRGNCRRSAVAKCFVCPALPCAMKQGKAGLRDGVGARDATSRLSRWRCR
jgi:hypothetical protein